MTEVHYRCDNCGTTTNKWISWMAFFGIRTRMTTLWEHDFHFCSEKCYQVFKTKPKKELETIANQILRNQRIQQHAES